MPIGYISLATDLAALFGPLTDPTTDTEKPSIVRHSSDTRAQALSRAAATIALDSGVWAVSAEKAGTVSYDGGSTLTGSGTSFLADFPPFAYVLIDIPAAKDPFGEGYRYAAFTGASASTNTAAAMNPTYGAYFAGAVTGGSVSGTTYAVESPTVGGGGFDSVIEVLMYYDFGWALYQAAYKYSGTSDAATLMSNADTIARLWWDHPITATARRAADPTQGGIIWPGSRHGCLGTLITWALRGCPGATKATPAATVTNVWSYAYRYAQAMHAQWLGGDRSTYPIIPYDVRDGGYALHWLVMLSRVHPDSTVRADCKAKAITAAIDYFCRLQFPDGTWRPGTNWANATLHTRVIDAAHLAMQPFLTGLLVNALIDLHRAIRTDVPQAAHAATILASIKLGVAGFMKTYGGPPTHPGLTAVTGGGNAAVRGFCYAYGDENFGYDENTYADLVPDVGTGERWFNPKASIENNFASDGVLSSAVAQTRFLNSTTVHAPYYAAIYESDPTKRAAFIAFGDELLDAQWEYTDGDGYRSQWFTPFPKNKDWDEHMRAQMRGLAWRKMAVAGLTEESVSGAAPIPPATPATPRALPSLTLPTPGARYSQQDQQETRHQIEQAFQRLAAQQPLQPITGSVAGNVALANLLTALAKRLITDATS